MKNFINLLVPKFGDKNVDKNNYFEMNFVQDINSFNIVLFVFFFVFCLMIVIVRKYIDILSYKFH